MADTAQGTPAEDVEYSENQIAVHWREEEYVQPPERFKEQANANDPSILERFAPDNFPQCFEEYAEMLTWEKKWDEIVDTSNPPFFKWASTASTAISTPAAMRTRSSGSPSWRRTTPRRSPTAIYIAG
jgi:hypothetical protein